MKRWILLILCLLVLLPGCGQRAAQQSAPTADPDASTAADPSATVVGVWNACSVFEPATEQISELPASYSTVTLYDDHSGTAEVSGERFALQWSYQETEEDGTLVFRCSIGGAPSSMYYKPAYAELWLYAGDYLLMYDRADGEG